MSGEEHDHGALPRSTLQWLSEEDHETRSGNLKGQMGWAVDIKIIQEDGRG